MTRVILTLLSVAAARLYAQPSCAPVSTRCVGSGQEYTDIQTAYLASAPGDLIYVFNGNYQGPSMTTVSGTSSLPIHLQAQSPAVQITTPANGAGDGINVEGANWILIDGFTVPSAPRNGIRVVTSIGTIVENCIVTAAGGQGILTGYLLSGQILHNTVSGTIGQHGIYVSNSNTAYDGVVVRGNVSHDNIQNGMQINAGCPPLDPSTDGVINGLLVEDNVVYNNGGNGFSVIDTWYSTFRNNLLYNNHAAGQIKLADEGCGFGSSYNVIVNNTLISDAYQIAGIRMVLGVGNIAFNNLIVSNTYKCVIDATGATCDTSGAGGIFYQAGVEKLTSQITGIFTNYAGLDFTLTAGSTAIGAGASSFQSIAAPRVDLLGNGRPVGGTYDAGAYEFGGTSIGTDSTAPTTPGTPTVVMNPYQVTLSWTASTDNLDLLGYVIYRDGAAYAPAYTNSFVDAAVMPGSSHNYVVYAIDGAGNRSAASGSAAVTVYGTMGCMNADTRFRSVLTSLEVGTFEFIADATPFGPTTTDAVIGLSKAIPSGFGDMALLIRFPGSGNMDVRNGAVYTADTVYPYTVGVSYHLRVVVNVSAHTYSVFVSTGGGGETTLASNYAFRTEQGSVTQLGYLSIIDDQPGSISLCSPKTDGQPIESLAYMAVTAQTLFSQASASVIVDANGTGKPVFDRPKPIVLAISRSLNVGDHGGLLYYAGSTPISVTLPTGLGAGFACTVFQDGTGTITFVGSGLTLVNRLNATRTVAQGSVAVIQCTTADNCKLLGDVH